MTHADDICAKAVRRAESRALSKLRKPNVRHALKSYGQHQDVCGVYPSDPRVLQSFPRSTFFEEG